MRLVANFAAAVRLGLWSTAVGWSVSLAGCCCGGLPSARSGDALLGCAAASGRSCEDTSCVVPHAGYCAADACSSLWAWPKRVLRRCCGPLMHPAAVTQSATEAEMTPPHARFHPVPTAPVFAQRYDYMPPERIMAPPPAHPRLAPHALPHLSQVQPLPAASQDNDDDRAPRPPRAAPLPAESHNSLPLPLPSPPPSESPRL
jgi:hypothetical protein